MQRVLTAALCAVLFCIARLSAQAPVRTITIGDQPSCPSCSIRLRKTVLIGDSDGGGSLPRTPSQVVQNSRGAIYLSLFMPPALAYEFDSVGRFVRRVGREGGGPGEYRSAFLARGSHDTLEILDFFNQRRNILSPDGKLVRTTPMPVASPTSVHLSGGQQIVSAAAGFSLVTGDGKFIRTIGQPTASATGRALSNIRESHNNMFWAFGSAPYTLELWSSNGNKDLTIQRSSRFFPRFDKPSSGADGSKPTPELLEAYEDSLGILWTVVVIPSQEWQKWLGPKTTVKGLLPYQKPRRDKMYDSIIEAFDLKRRVLLQSIRMQGYFSHFLRDNVIGQQLEDEDGFKYLQLHRIELIRR